MQNNRSRLVMAFIFTALFLVALVGTTVVGGFVLGRVASLRALRTGAQLAGGLAAISFLVAAGAIAINAALQPGSWLRKLGYVLPAYFLGFTLTGVILFLVGIGTVGPFSTVWLVAGALLTVIATSMAAGRLALSPQTWRTALNALRLASLFSVIAWAAMVIAIVMFLLNPASARAGNFNRTQAASVAAATPAATPATTNAQPERGEREAFRGPGGRNSTTPLAIGGGLLTVFLGLELFGVLRARRGQNVLAAEGSNSPALTIPASSYGRETGRALLSCLAITVVAWGIGQLIPVSHTNPPAQTAIQWDSPQTQALAKRACMDCHSDETTWPWYSYVAPGSWLTLSHVSDGREELNLSELNTLQSFRRTNLANEVAEQIRSGAMPPKDYLYLHPDARLTAAEKAQLIEGMQKSLANSLANSSSK